MELHAQHQQHLQPDVVPTPYTEAPESSEDHEGEGKCSIVETAADLKEEIEKVSQESQDVSQENSKDGHQIIAGSNPVVFSPATYGFGQYPMTLTCPCCGYTVLTYVQYDISIKQYMICFLLFICMLWPCSLLPCLFRGMYDVYHFCPVCHKLIGICKA